MVDVVMLIGVVAMIKKRAWVMTKVMVVATGKRGFKPQLPVLGLG